MPRSKAVSGILMNTTPGGVFPITPGAVEWPVFTRRSTDFPNTQGRVATAQQLMDASDDYCPGRIT
jgi:hypothetical protein